MAAKKTRKHLYKKPDSQYWKVRVTVAGKEYRLSTGEVDLTAAKAVAKQLIAKARKAAGIRSELGTMRLSQCRDADIERWKASAASAGNRDPSEQTRYLEYVWDRILLAHFGDCEAHEVTTESIERYRTSRQNAGKKKQTIKKELLRLKWALDRARKAGFIQALPEFPKLGKDTKDRAREGQVIDSEDLVRWLQLLPEDAHDEALFIACTAMRRDQARKITPEWLRLTPGDACQSAILTAPERAVKTRSAHAIPLHSVAVQILQRRDKGPGVPYFPSQERKRVYTKAALSLGLPRCPTLRDIRCTIATLAHESGIPLAAISRLLGHSNLQTTSIYIKPRPQHIAAAAHAIEQLIATKIELGAAPKRDDNADRLARYAKIVEIMESGPGSDVFSDSYWNPRVPAPNPGDVSVAQAA